MGRKCHWAESGLLGSAQMALATEVQETSLNNTIRMPGLTWAALEHDGPRPMRQPT
jgi:hypothetical protein